MVSVSSAENRKQALKTIWDAAIEAVSGQQAVENAIARDNPYQPDLIISVGKAATGMCRGALNSLARPCEAIVVTKYEHADDDIRSREGVRVIESGHPIPDQNSLDAPIDAGRQPITGTRIGRCLGTGRSPADRHESRRSAGDCR